VLKEQAQSAGHISRSPRPMDARLPRPSQSAVIPGRAQDVAIGNLFGLTLRVQFGRKPTASNTGQVWPSAGNASGNGVCGSRINRCAENSLAPSFKRAARLDITFQRQLDGPWDRRGRIENPPAPRRALAQADLARATATPALSLGMVIVEGRRTVAVDRRAAPGRCASVPHAVSHGKLPRGTPAATWRHSSVRRGEATMLRNRCRGAAGVDQARGLAGALV